MGNDRENVSKGPPTEKELERRGGKKSLGPRDYIKKGRS